MRVPVLIAAACMLVAAHAATGDTTSPPDSRSGAPQDEPACSSPGLTPPTPLGAHATSYQDYPPEAAQRGDQGDVTVSLLIHEDGTVTAPVIIGSSGSQQLDDATASLVAHWRYNPATRDGKPVSCHHRAMVAWRLSETWNAVDGDLQFLPPDLPDSAAKGITTIWVSLDETGAVLSTRVLASSGNPELDAAGMRLVQSSKFAAPQMNGKPMQSAILIEVHWPPAGSKSP